MAGLDGTIGATFFLDAAHNEIIGIIAGGRGAHCVIHRGVFRPAKVLHVSMGGSTS